jgi:hypothetical protein
MQIVDISGTTNEKGICSSGHMRNVPTVHGAGEACEGYDPINDADWLQSEIHGALAVLSS